jgi:hypothetical protein
MAVDAGLIVAAGMVGCAALVLGVRRWRGRGADRESGPPALATRVPTFRVVTLGLQGSGKTLLLTSVYRHLQTPGDRGYYLRAPYEQLIELNRWYREVASVEEDWPRGTSRGELREFEFSLMTHVNDTAETILKLGYLEYPGELLTDPDAPGSTAQATLLESVERADALVGIIDGLRVLQAYRGDRRGALILQTTLDAMINSMLSARTPIVFVITKWDLLDGLHPDENTRLHIVRTLLTGIPGFRDLVRVHSPRRIIRLIPVTAVGHDFAVLDDGQVRKKPAGRFEPVNVDMVLSTVVPDVLRQVELSLDLATRQAILAEAQRRMRLGPREALQSLAAFVAERAGRVLLSAVGGGLLTESGVALLLDARSDPADHRARLATLSAADRRAEEFIQARRRVIHSLQDQVARLESTLPASRLTGEV